MHPIKHFRTITKHRHRVIELCFKCGIGFQGLFHDISKYSPTEFWAGAKYYTGTRSPNDGERNDYGYSKAWLHHKGRNRHHFEYWTDYNHHLHRLVPIKMPKKYVVEMFCDRVAASKIYKGKDYTDRCAYDYFMSGIETRFIDKETSDALEKMLVILKDNGEQYTADYVKKWLKNDNEY